ncbi:MAG: hypothetical protein MZV70_19455 [Desulfobacterales bacterium]|nr:hypothetical protein [Desulfobacterales bacterium]
MRRGSRPEGHNRAAGAAGPVRDSEQGTVGDGALQDLRAQGAHAGSDARTRGGGGYRRLSGPACRDGPIARSSARTTLSRPSHDFVRPFAPAPSASAASNRPSPRSRRRPRSPSSPRRVRGAARHRQGPGPREDDRLPPEAAHRALRRHGAWPASAPQTSRTTSRTCRSGREPARDAGRPLSVASINRQIEFLRHMMNWAVGRDFLDRTPFRRAALRG